MSTDDNRDRTTVPPRSDADLERDRTRPLDVDGDGIRDDREVTRDVYPAARGDAVARDRDADGVPDNREAPCTRWSPSGSASASAA